MAGSGMALGRVPDPLVLTLSPKASLTIRLKIAGTGSWPTGTVLQLGLQVDPRGAEHRWSFQVSGQTATITVPEADLAGPIRRVNRDSRARLWLNYGPDSGGEFLWAAGPVQVRG